MAEILPEDWLLYVLTDARLIGQRSMENVVAAAVRGGAKVVQYREKQASTRKMVEEAARLSELCRKMGALFLVNDRIDIALAVGADGVHVGQDDMPLPIARKLLGAEKIIGVTVHNEAEIRQAEEEGADYLSLAPVFTTSTKPDHQEPMGLDGVRRLVAIANKPIVAISGINSSNAAEVIKSGADGICVVSAIMAAQDPERAAHELYDIARAAKKASR